MSHLRLKSDSELRLIKFISWLRRAFLRFQNFMQFLARGNFDIMIVVETDAGQGHQFFARQFDRNFLVAVRNFNVAYSFLITSLILIRTEFPKNQLAMRSEWEGGK